MDLIAGQGRKRGVERVQEMASDAGTWRGTQIQAAEAGGWRVGTKSKWMAFWAGRGGGERVQDRGDTTTNATDGGVVV